MKRLLRTLTILLAALATIFAVAGCSNSKAGDTQIDKEKVITVIASTNVWGSVAKQLGGRYVDVTSILNNTGTDAHDYEPSTNDISKFQHAQVAILNGAGYDEWAAKAAGQSKAIVIDAAAAGGKKTGDNPHVWFSAAVRNKTADEITAAYIKLMPSEKAEFEKLNKDWHTEEDDLEAQLQTVAQADGKMPYGAIESVGDYLAQDMGITEALKKGDMKMLIANSQEKSQLSDQLTDAADSGNIPVVDITEQMPSQYKTLNEWLKAIAEQIQATQKKK